MLRISLQAVAAFALLLLPSLASAVPTPVKLTVGHGSEQGFAFSYLTDATTNCEVIGGVQFCKGGTKVSLSGELDAIQDGLKLTAIQGTIIANGLPDIIVTDGEIDFASSAPDTFGGFLETANYGTFYFLDHLFNAVANTFDGTTAYLWGNNWNTGNPGNCTGPNQSCWGIDLGLEVPEPGSALLLVSALLGFAALRPRSA